MSFTYSFNSDDRQLHIVVDRPSSVGDFGETVPGILQEIAGTTDVVLLLEIQSVAPYDGPEDHDLGFFFVNQIKSRVSKLAVVCRPELIPNIRELTELIRNQGSRAEIFDSLTSAREWLAG